MLKESGISLLEMLIAIGLTALLLVNTIYFIPYFYYQFLQLFHTQQIKQMMHQTIQPLIKDIRRAGFMLNTEQKMGNGSIVINDKKDCVMINYMQLSKNNQRNKDKYSNNSSLIIYRLTNDNIEFAMRSADEHALRWYQLFDPKIIKVGAFLVTDHHHYAKITINAELRKNSAISYTLTQAVKYENR